MYTMDIGVRQGSVFRLDPHPECNAFPPGSDLLPRKYVENLRIADLGCESPDHGQHVAHRPSTPPSFPISDDFPGSRKGRETAGMKWNGSQPSRSRIDSATPLAS